MPNIVTGLRVGIGIAWVLVIVAEWTAVRTGLGFVLLDAYGFIRIDFVMAAMISVGLMGRNSTESAFAAPAISSIKLSIAKTFM
jgi:ABC-type nitrate/sulfonate/bicarbonate transport system permease component